MAATDNDNKRLARIESKLTKIGLYLNIPLEKESVVPRPENAHIGYDNNDDKPYIEIGSLHVSLYDLYKLYRQLEMSEPLELRIRGEKLGELSQPLEV